MVLGLESKSPNQKISSATIFPIAFPLIAGPGTLSTLIALNSEISKLELVLAILINCIVIYIFLLKVSPVPIIDASDSTIEIFAMMFLRNARL